MTTNDTPSADDQPSTHHTAVRKAFAHLGHEGRLLVLYDLQTGSKRFTEIKRSTGLSAATLSRTLASLQARTLITSRTAQTSHAATYYCLTEKGAALHEMFKTLEEQVTPAEWSE
ncbi:winged helix-turn-helix transcriptional regulator [Halobacterium sp. KA-6]|uniref:winged helix-turn-helix transcriptional regulator n=1 Tax=Halobacterium sp. KA-6 TaxID=2896368 RepID=UPI001E3DA027|nr:helix-turn-helix domain-containing protein [Halobacterium sp. KA-6]MCD2204048.1 helix-turn-helix transcriptional regulator [Halobacterium sp. KA-6]